MIQLVGNELYQWDTGRLVQIVSDSDSIPHEVHFSTELMDFAYVCKIYNQCDKLYCAIPDIVLQESGKLFCYEICRNDNGKETVSFAKFKILKRNRPDDYIYTEQDLITLEELAKRPLPVQSDWEQTDETELDYIKNKPEIPNAQIQSDWEQCDDTAIDHIKNRTHYYTETLVEVLPETTVTSLEGVIRNGNYYGYYSSSVPGHGLFETGSEYLIIVDGVEYREIARNTDLLGVYDNLDESTNKIRHYTLGSMPIAFGGYDYMGDFIYVIMETPKETHTIAAYYVDSTLKQLDEKFIPNTIARAEDVDAVNDKIDALESYIDTNSGGVTCNSIILASATEDSTKKFKITVDDSGTLIATEVTQ